MNEMRESAVMLLLLQSIVILMLLGVNCYILSSISFGPVLNVRPQGGPVPTPFRFSTTRVLTNQNTYIDYYMRSLGMSRVVHFTHIKYLYTDKLALTSD